MLYDDGKDVRLLNTLNDQEASEDPNKAQEELGRYTTWDSVMKVDRDMKVIAILPSSCPHYPPYLQCFMALPPL